MTTDAPMRVRRGSVHPDYLAVQIETLQIKDKEEELSSSSSSALSRGVFHAKDEPSLHALPKKLYQNPQELTAIKVSNCPLRYLGTKVPKDGEEALRIERSLSISPLYNLREVIVVNAKLQSLPVGFGSMPFLTVINVARNVISTLPPDIADGPKIHTIDVSCNLLNSELPEGILDSRSLKVLKLENNDLRAKHFPEQDDLKGARLQLRTLSVDEAVMKGLPKGVKPYPVKSARHFEVLLEKNHVPTLKRQQQSSSFQMIPPKGDEARDVIFSPHALVGYRWEA